MKWDDAKRELRERIAQGIDTDTADSIDTRITLLRYIEYVEALEASEENPIGKPEEPTH